MTCCSSRTEQIGRKRVRTVLPARSTASPVPAQLAAGYPPEQRASVERLFGNLLTKYQEFEKVVGLPSNDIAGALAAFVLACYSAAQKAEVSDEQMRAVATQLRRSLASRSTFRKMPLATKQELYDTLAIAAMFMAVTRMGLEKRPDARMEEALHRQAVSYGREVAGFDVRTLVVSEAGLALSISLNDSLAKFSSHQSWYARPLDAQKGTSMQKSMSSLFFAVVLAMSPGCDSETNTCSTNGNCVCEQGGTCDFDCPQGQCNYDCPVDADCTINCAGGSCNASCGAGSNCDIACPQGGCVVECQQATSCTLECPDGACTCAGCD